MAKHNTAIEINLKPFCSDDLSLPQLHQPYNIGDYTYAVNGKTAIRTTMIPEYHRVTSKQPEPPRAIENMFTKAIEAEGDWLDLPLDIFKAEAKKTLCEFCHGNGQHSCDCDHCENDCEACNGIGCFDISPEYKFTNGVILSGEYLDNLKRLPGPVQVLLKEEPCIFRGDGWYVLIMPMRRADEHPVDVDFPTTARNHTTLHGGKKVSSK